MKVSLPDEEERETYGMQSSHWVSHDKLLSFLADPRSYPCRPKRVGLIQTHASYLFIAGQYVYKIKKAVNFGFLDFSSLAKRHYFCEREIMLNQRLCSGIYLGVVAISLRSGELTFGAGDEIAEYAVKMRRFQVRYFLPHLLKLGQVSTKDLDRIVQTLKVFYNAQAPTRTITAWGRVEMLKINTEENFRQTKAFIGCTLSRPAFEAIRTYTDHFYARNFDLFESRLREQRIRDCHGDLHLEHIHLSPDAVSIYDCIEFNDRFRYLDVASDVAFLAMDLDHHGHPDLSRYFAKRISNALADASMLRLLSFYKCYRAYVRGKVESLHRNAPELPEPERSEASAQAERYFRLALNYAVCGSEPMALVVTGRVGSGKSTLANSLAHELGWQVFSSDRTRKQLARVPLYARGGVTSRHRLYSEMMTEKTYFELSRLAQGELKQGRSVIIEATFGRRSHRDRLRCQLDRAGITYHFVETKAFDGILKGRLKARGGRYDEVSDARLEDFETINRTYDPPTELGPHHYFAVNTAHPLGATVRETLKALVQRTKE